VGVDIELLGEKTLMMKWMMWFLMAITASARAEDTQPLVDRIAREVFAEFTNLKSNQLAITLVVLSKDKLPVQASYRGGESIYPASVIKLFYLVAAHRWMEDGRIADSAEVRRAMRDMIVDSGNEPTHYIVDLLTGTTSGPELPEPEMKEWSEKRNAVNRYFRSLGFQSINVNQKPWCEGPYGRERVWVGTNYNNRNTLTTDATARLLADIATGLAVSAPRSAQMMELVQRDFAPGAKNDQGTRYTGAGLPKGAKLWSKAGWTSTTRHDAAYVELPTGERFVLVTFTTGHANNRDIIPSVARRMVAGLTTDSAKRQ
jgi:beta-lactamase class A